MGYNQTNTIATHSHYRNLMICPIGLPRMYFNISNFMPIQIFDQQLACTPPLSNEDIFFGFSRLLIFPKPILLLPLSFYILLSC